MLKQQAALIEQLARTEPPRIERKLTAKPEQAMALVAGGVEIYLPLAGMLDIEKELARLDGANRGGKISYAAFAEDAGQSRVYRACAARRRAKGAGCSGGLYRHAR